MAIIRYQLDSGSIPSYITDGGWFPDSPSANYLIGIGSGGGTEMTKSELLDYVLTQHASTPYKTVNEYQPELKTSMTNAEVTTLVNDWCTARGIS
tara:strand:- start:346 stop:630 length:285 start_codon:yes stop_codon:yes gene_type:complete